jgi:signal peptidase I
MLLIVAANAVLSFLVLAAFLALGVRWAKLHAANCGRARVFAAAGLIWVGSTAIALGSSALDAESAPDHGPAAFRSAPARGRQIRQYAGFVAVLGANVVILVAVIRRVLNTAPRQTLMIGVAAVAGSALHALLTVCVVIPFLVEAFVNQGNAMAPTILGKHGVVVCPRCGGQAYCAPEPPARPDLDQPGWSSTMICGRCRRTSPVTEVPKTVDRPDRFLVDKLRTPRRWNVVVYQYPADPAVRYVSRLVGLPGERVAIRDGSVWINGRKESRPAALEGIEYTRQPGGHGTTSGGPDPGPDGEWTLGADEYFVLSDFTTRGKDSRVWVEGAPGHSPWAVPRSHIVGVASYTYWPPSRWRDLRPK